MNTVLTPPRTTPAATAGAADTGFNIQWWTLCVVATTVDSETAARELARLLVLEQVAACVQVQAVTSHYVWEGQLKESSEWRLVCKTLPDVLGRLSTVLRSNHPYEVAQITMRTERCLGDYADWLKKQVRA